MWNNKRFYFILGSVVALSLRCVHLNDTSGTSSGVETKVCGTILDHYGMPASHTTVRLIPSDFNPSNESLRGGTFVDTTDSGGAYRILVSDSGLYNLQAENPADRTSLLVFGIKISKGEITVPTDTVRKTGTLLIPPPPDVDSLRGIVFILGTGIYSRFNREAGYFVLDSIPAGPIPGIYYTESGSVSPPVLLLNSVIIPPDSTVSLLYRDWAFSVNYRLNTTSSGADVSGNVLGFPLLLRLSAANFNFAMAKNDGSDIRLEKWDHTPLPFEIEYWDSFRELAEVWVMLDTIYGNDNTRSITLRNGNTAVASGSDGAVVFALSKGFQGVWHLADSGDATVSDAMGLHNGLIKYGDTPMNTAVASVQGVIGRGMRLQGAGIKHWIDLGSNRSFVNNKQEMTISIWISPDSSSLSSQQLIAFTKGSTLTPPELESRISLSLGFDKARLQARELDNGATFTLTSVNSFSPQQWHHVVGVAKIPQDSMYLYVDGLLWDAHGVAFNATATDATNSTAASIGADNYGMADHFYGIIDEARIEGVARSADWIKLSYMNQKEIDALLE